MATLSIDNLDLFQNIRVSPGEGFDPMDTDFREPQFGDSAVGVGDPLLNIAEHNREIIVPVHFKSRTDTVTNLLTDPSGESAGLTEWTTNGSGGQWPMTVEDSSHATEGDYAFHVNGVNTLGPTSFPGIQRASTAKYIPVTAGLAYSVALDYEIIQKTTASSNFQVLLRWWQSDRITTAGADGAANFTLVAGAKGRAQLLNAVAPAGAAFANVIFYNSSAVIGEVFEAWFDRIIMVQGATVPPYFDGNSPGCKWDGTRPLSTSSTYVGKGGLHQHIADVAKTLASGKQLVWRDVDADYSTYYNIQFARFEPEYNYRRSQRLWASGVVRIFVKPYGTTGTSRIVGTAAATGVAIAVNVGSFAGDISSLLDAKVRGGNIDQNLIPGHLHGLAVVPTGYAYDTPVASVVLMHPSAVVSGATEAVGSQVIRIDDAVLNPLKRSLQYGKISFSPASMYEGRNRVLGVVTAGGVVSLETTDDDGMPIYSGRAPIASGALSARGGFNVVDLGVLTVDTADTQATVSMTLAVNTNTDGILNPVAYRGDFFRLNRVLMFPENRLLLVPDVSRRLLAYANASSAAISTATQVSSFDVLGNPFAIPSVMATIPMSNTAGFTFTQQVTSANAVAAAMISHPTVNDLSMEIAHNGFNGAAPSQMVAIGKFVDGTNKSFSARLHYTGANCVLNLLSNGPGGNINYTAPSLLASTAIVGSVGLNVVTRLSFSQRGYALGAQVENYFGSVVATLSASHSDANKSGQAFMAAAGTGAVVGVYGFMVFESPSVAITNRDYLYAAGTRDQIVRLNGASTLYSGRLESTARGVISTVNQYDNVVGISLPIDMGPTNDLISLEVRLQERFTYSR